MISQIYTYNQYLRDKFGQRVHRISLDPGFSCPNLDGTLSKEGCSYCNNKAFSVYAGQRLNLEEQIQRSINYYGKALKVTKFIAYFQAFSNTYALVEQLKQVYDVILKFPQIVGLTISTRPDCVDREKIKLIAEYKKDYLVWLEYGLQTTHNQLLEKINRKHTYEDFLQALAITREYGINVGAHVILGLPGAQYDDMMVDAQRIARLDIQGIKFHVLHILKNTPLETEYNRGKIKLLDCREYVKIVCDFLELLPKSMVVLRLVSSADKQYLVAPDWINNRAQVIEAINREFVARESCQGSKCREIISQETEKRS
jgi:hypothetical protein